MDSKDSSEGPAVSRMAACATSIKGGTRPPIFHALSSRGQLGSPHPSCPLWREGCDGGACWQELRFLVSPWNSGDDLIHLLPGDLGWAAPKTAFLGSFCTGPLDLSMSTQSRPVSVCVYCSMRGQLLPCLLLEFHIPKWRIWTRKHQHGFHL